MNKSLTAQARGWVKGVFDNIRNFFEDYDLASLPAFTIFMVVITAGLAVNYFFLKESKQVSELGALAISLLFEVGIGAWKFQGHRTKNSEAQAQIVNWAMWLSTALAFLMLVSSLTRAIEWGWIVAGAALVHVVGFLVFDQNDDIRNNRRKNRMAFERIGQKNINSDNAIQEAEADLRIIDKITTELSRLQKEYVHLPIEQLEFVLEAYRTRLLAEYNASEAVQSATQKVADVNKDGVIGKRVYSADSARPNQ